MSFLGKDESQIILYLERNNWSFRSVQAVNKYDSVFEWEFYLADESFVELKYHIYAPTGKAFTIKLNLLNTEFSHLLNNYSAYGLIPDGVRRDGTSIQNNFHKGKVNVKLIQAPVGDGMDFSLIVTDSDFE
jgi:hypothetical protein